jgi:serine/threonine protein kinase/tetratricopeptide (TPR) repeat protein
MPDEERSPPTRSDADDQATGTARAEGPPDSERRIGPYRILRELGHGGMGTVYLAARADEQFHKRVALKIIRSGADSAEVVRHFKRERQILAGLDHPNIARLLDGGTTDDGLPYFVMEYIDGEPLLGYCDSRSLSVVERLRLFQSVCSAVQYAHRNLIVHRDIKPGNILVALDGAPRLLDFGIAKLINPELAGEAPTATAMVMTPAYASPEQARGERITTATDVYSLGVVLYELLTGHHPYRLKSRQALDVLMAIAAQEPEKASTAVARVVEMTEPLRDSFAPITPEVVARTREGTPERLMRRLRGDLDNILLMALRKEPQRRYASVEAFSDDIRRYLEGMPVKARKPTVGYRAGKFVKRHVVGLGAALAVLVLLVGFAVAMGVQSARVARERDLAQKERATAQKERETAQRVSGFLVDLFKVSDPSEARGNTITAREVLDKGAAKIATELKDQPEVRATLMDTMGNVYRNLGLYDKAIPLLEDALDTRKAVLGPEHLDVARSMNTLATLLYAKGDFARAEALQRDVLAMRRKLLGNENLEVAKSLNNLGNMLGQRGDYTGAEALYRESLAIRRKLLGNDHPDVAICLDNLAMVLAQKGDYAGAEALYRETLPTLRKIYGNEHPEVANSLSNLAIMLHQEGDDAGAERLHREALAMRRRLLGDEHPDVAQSMTGLAETLLREGKPDEAEPLAREALAVSRKTLPGGHPLIAESESVLGECLTLLNRYEEAQPLLVGSYPVLKSQTGETSKETRGALQRIVSLYEAWGKPDKAARYRAELTPRGADAQR